MASRKSEQEAAQIVMSYNKIEEDFTQRLFKEYTKSGKTMEYKAFKQMAMSPANLKERAIAEAIWESVPADELMGLKDVQEIAHKAVQELANYNDVNSFQSYLNALRILVINRDPAVLEIM